MKWLKQIPIHPFAFAVFPILALLAHNILEVEAGIAIRPLLLSLAATIAGLCIGWLILRDWRRAGLVTTFLLVLFFSYGHVYQALEANPVLGINLGRHRYLGVVYSLALVSGCWWLIRKVKDLVTVTQVLNIIGVVLLVYPSYQILRVSARATAGAQEVENLLPGSKPLTAPVGEALPDIYYIILDGYTRGDALKRDLGYDNSAFLDGLQQMGFYVAACSRSNYSNTHSSLISSLNLDYIPELKKQSGVSGQGIEDVLVLLKHSRVRGQLEALGYQTVAFETGYEWSRLSDADIYLGREQEPLTLQRVTPFEAMLAKSTAILPLADMQYGTLKPRFNDLNFPYSDHINRQLFILDQIPKIAAIPGPTFAFVHVLIPHVPYVFGPHGEILTDPGFYGGRKSAPINHEYERRGYTGQVQYVSERILPILKTILAESSTPPIIVMQGDHGLKAGNRLQILNAYYLPGEGKERLYPTITPVNSFRLIFDTYFGTSYGLLQDASYFAANFNDPVPETASECEGE